MIDHQPATVLSKTVTQRETDMKQDQKTIPTTRIARKQQSDRLLKQLPLSERRRQQHIRDLIARDLKY